MPPTGSTRRHCERCQTPVHDLSAMTRAEARLLLLRSLGQSLCIRYRTGPEGQLHFRPPPPRPAGPLVTALAGLMAACTSTTPAVDAPALPEIDWAEPSPTIPGWDQPSTLEPGVEQGVIGGVIGGVSGVTMGAMVPTMACSGYPAHEALLAPPDVRVEEDDDARDRAEHHRPRPRARARRRAERKQRRRIRRREHEAQRAAQRAERTIQREIREAEREVERETRRAERKRRRQARRARRRQQRALRAEARRLRREARRAARGAG